MMAALSGAAVAGFGYARAQAGADLASDTRLTGKLLAGRIRGCVTTRLELVRSMSREWSAGGLRTDEEVPHEENRAALGKDLRTNPVASPVLAKAREDKAPRLSPALQLYQGGSGFVGYFPLVAEDGAVLGYFNAVFRGQPLVDACLLDLGQDEYAVGLRD